jgi:peptidoglycan/xylan/chitin deacetylase (PgdA/CDA1 family)
VHRRQFLSAAAAGTALAALSGCSADASGDAGLLPTTSPDPVAVAEPPPVTVAPTMTPPVVQRAPMVSTMPVPHGVVTELPGEGDLMAWTVDDGSNSDVIAAYAAFAASSGIRLTFFVNGIYPGWAANQPALQPLVDSGQVQLGNHTWSHADLTSLSDAAIQDELGRNGEFITKTFGVDAAPYYRPPYGFRDVRTDAAAAKAGYTTAVLWYGTLSDSSLLTQDQLLGFADKWFKAGRIVIGHANFLTVTTVFPQLRQLLSDRGLTTVTLDEVFARG